jgi:MFS family permease
MPTGSLWRNGDFNRLWAGQTVSVIGSEVTDLALPTLAVLTLHASVFQVGLLAASQRFAFPLLALPVGVVADRLNRRRMMVAADLARCLLLGTIPVLAALGALRLWELYLVALLTGGCSVVFDVAYLAYLPVLAGRQHLADANARLEFSFSASAISGPGVGGLLVQAIGAARTMAVDSVSFLASAVMLLLIGRREAPPSRRELPPFSLRQLGREMGEGLRVVRRDPVLLSLVLTMGAFIFGAHGVSAILVVYAYRVLHFSPGTLGAVITVTGAGAVLGAFSVRAVQRRLGIGAAMSVSGVVCGLCLAAIPLASLAAPVAVLSVLSLVRGFGGTVNNATQVTLRQLATPDHLNARMNAVFRTVYWGAWPLGELVGGALGSAAGVIPAMVILGASAVLAMAVMPLTPAGRLRLFPQQPH